MGREKKAIWKVKNSPPPAFRMSHSESLFSLNVYTHGGIKKSIYESNITTLQFRK